MSGYDCRNTYFNFGSYLRSRGYDSCINQVIKDIQAGKYIVDNLTRNSNNSLTINGDLTVTGKLIVKDTISGKSTNPIVQTVAGRNFTLSSLKYKSNIKSVDLTEAKKILNINPVSFTYNEEPNVVHIGAIAEELDKLGLKEYVKYDENNSPDGIYYSNLVVPLIEIVKDLSTRITNLEAVTRMLLEKQVN